MSQWRAAQAEFAARILPPSRREAVPISVAVGRVLAEPVALAAGSLIEWRHLPLLLATGSRTVPVYPRVRAGIVTVSDRAGAAGDATAALVGAAFERLGGNAFIANTPEPGHRLRPVLEMFASRCELIFVVGELGPQGWQTLEPCVGLSGPGGLPCFPIGATLVILLSPSPQAALLAFTAFAVPLIWRLQGRGDRLPAIRLAYDRQTPAGAGLTSEMVLVSERFVADRCTVTACDESLGPTGLAGASGIAWRPDDLAGVHGGTVAYLPFDEWLR